MSLKCSDIIKHIESLCPTSLAMEWDNVGLLVGDRNQDVNKILIALDATEDVAQEAVDKKVDLIVTHHPLIFKPIKRVTSDNAIGRITQKLIKNNISLYSAHTNLDIAEGGINDILAQMFELKNIHVLDKITQEKLKKLVVFVPQSHAETVREAIGKAGAGWIGNYSDCSFNINGTGTFKPLDNAQPFIGSLGKLEKVEEARIETIFTEKIQNKVISEMLKVHPYEEVAYDIYPLENKGRIDGLGRVGELTNHMTLAEFVEIVKKRLNIPLVRVIGNLEANVRKVAICSGSGMDLLSRAKSSGADVYITGDAKYHEAQDALALGMNVIDAGHYDTENIMVPILKDYLGKLQEVEVVESNIDANPFRTI